MWFTILQCLEKSFNKVYPEKSLLCIINLCLLIEHLHSDVNHKFGHVIRVQDLFCESQNPISYNTVISLAWKNVSSGIASGLILTCNQVLQIFKAFNYQREQ